MNARVVPLRFQSKIPRGKINGTDVGKVHRLIPEPCVVLVIMISIRKVMADLTVLFFEIIANYLILLR